MSPQAAVTLFGQVLVRSWDGVRPYYLLAVRNGTAVFIQCRPTVLVFSNLFFALLYDTRIFRDKVLSYVNS